MSSARPRVSLPPGWPAIAGFALVVAASVTLALTAVLRHQTQSLRSQIGSIAAEQTHAAMRDQQLALTDALRVPAYSSRLADVATIAGVLKRQKLEATELTYRSGSIPDAQLRTLSTDLQVQSDYLAAKNLAAELLRKLPHAYIEDLRLERDTAAPVRLRTTIRLMLVYESDRSKELP